MKSFNEKLEQFEIKQFFRLNKHLEEQDRPPLCNDDKEDVEGWCNLENKKVYDVYCAVCATRYFYVKCPHWEKDK